MAERIKGITVEISGDTVGLDKALSKVNKTSKSLQTELKDVQRLLKFDPNNAKLLAQKQELLNKSIENTTDKLNTLKAAQKQVQEQFEKGTIGAEEYRAFQRELAQTEQQLKSSQTAMKNMADEQQAVQTSTQRLKQLFDITGGSLEKYSDILGTKLVRAIQNGTATSRDLERAFEKIGTEATGSSDHIKELRESLDKLASGEASAKQVRKQLQQMSKDAQEAEGSVKDLGSELGNLTLGVAAGVGVGSVVDKALESETLETKIDIAFEVPEESKAAIKEAVQSIQAYGIEGPEALEATRRLWVLNGDASDATNQRIIKGAGVIATTYQGIDVTQLIQETAEIGEALGISQEQALAMTNTLLKMGFPPEEIDIISEYGSQLQRAGYDAGQIQGIFAAGIATKSWNIDVLLDGLKEGRIRITEFGTGVDDTTKKMIEGTGISATKLQEWGTAIAEGGQKGQEAMNEVSVALSTIEDDTKRNEIGTRIFGTLWEEQGDKITTVLDGANTQTGNLKTNIDDMNGAIAATDSTAQVELNNALIDMNNALMPLYTNVANFVTLCANWISQNPQIAAGIGAVAAVIGFLAGAIGILTPVITFLVGIFTRLLPIFGWIRTAASVVGVAIAGISGPVWIAIAAIAAIIAIGVLLYKNWQKISDGAMSMSKKVGDSFMKMHTQIGLQMGKIQTAIEVKWNNIKSYLMNTDLKTIGRNVIQGFINGISAMSNPLRAAVRALASQVPDGLKSFLNMGSPSKLTEELGEFTGEGFAIGMENSINKIGNMSKQMAAAAVPDVKTSKATANAGNTAPGKAITVNFHSPKALNVRDANKQLQRTLNKLSLQW